MRSVPLLQSLSYSGAEKIFKFLNNAGITKRPKVKALLSTTTNPESLVEVPTHQPQPPMTEVSAYQQQFLVPDNPDSSNLNLFMALCKGEQSTTNHIPYFVSYNLPTPTFIQFALLKSSVFIPRSYYEFILEEGYG